MVTFQNRFCFIIDKHKAHPHDRVDTSIELKTNKRCIGFHTETALVKI
jgi:hypothetical protein